jgi:exodeoxyribonuclease-3
MKVASFNVNSIRARLPIVLDWLSQTQPDVLAVQETKVQDKDFPGEAFDQIGYNYCFAGQKSYNGVAIFSRSQIKDVKLGFDDEPKEQPRLIKANINGVTIVNSYIPQGDSPESEKFQYKLDFYDRLKKYFDDNFKPTEPVVWVGDLNIAAEARDVYNPVGLWGSVCYHEQVQQALKQVLNWGFVDVFRKHCDESGQYTFWDYRLRGSVKRNLGWRLDYIMATKPLAEKSTACYIDKTIRSAERPSDHTPIIAQFQCKRTSLTV